MLFCSVREVIEALFDDERIIQQWIIILMKILDHKWLCHAASQHEAA